jgi:hypothetical protein
MHGKAAPVRPQPSAGVGQTNQGASNEIEPNPSRVWEKVELLIHGCFQVGTWFTEAAR